MWDTRHEDQDLLYFPNLLPNEYIVYATHMYNIQWSQWAASVIPIMMYFVLNIGIILFNLYAIT
jgi:hypothetical protein